MPRPWRRAKRCTAFDWIDVLPDDLFFGCHLENGAVGARANERVSIGEPLSAGNERGKEISLFRRRVAPHRPVRPTGLSRAKKVSPLRIDGEFQLVHRRVT